MVRLEMPSARLVFSYMRRFTAIQLLIVSGAILSLLTITHGMVFSLSVVAVYFVANTLWSLRLQPLVRSVMTTSLSQPTSQSDDFTGSWHRVETIKGHITNSFIHSWTRVLKLDVEVEQRLSEASHLLVDELLLLVTSRQANIYCVITDLLKGAHIHITKYNTALVEPVQRKHIKIPESRSSIKARYLSASLSEWDQVHKVKQRDYLHSVTIQMLVKLLPLDDPSPIALEALTSIISENVISELLLYLTRKENLLKLVIRILSDDFESLVESARLSTSKLVTDGETSKLDDDLQGISEPSAAQLPVTSRQEVVSIDSEEKSVLWDLSTSGEPGQHSLDDGGVGNSEEEDSPDGSGKAYVSANLNKYFKIAPNSRQMDRKVNEAVTSCDSSKPKTISMVSLSPALAITSTPQPPATVASSVRRSTVPAMTMAAAFNTNCLSSAELSTAMPVPASSSSSLHENHHRTEFNSLKSAPDNITSDSVSLQITSQSIDSGVADIKSNLFSISPDSCRSLQYTGVKYLSIRIPTTSTRTERLGSSKYTLYVISYQAMHPSEDNGEPDVREITVYRRYREFMNLRGRLEKSSRYSKALRSIKSPSWWQQLSLAARKPQEVERRRAQLENFLQQLIVKPLISESKDLEEFLAYNGGAEIEFVQEKVEFIPPAARIDKVVIRMFDKVTDKLSSQPNLSEYAETGSRRKSKQEGAVIQDYSNLTMFDTLKSVQSDLLTLKEEFNSSQSTNLFTSRHYHSEPITDEEYHTQSEALADSLLQLLLLLIQRHSDTSKNSKVVSVVSSVLLPYLTQWLRNKVLSYSTPPELCRLLDLFTQAIWPDVEEEVISYDIDKLEAIARQCVLDELPAPVVFLMRDHIDSIVTDIFSIVDEREVNEQLGYILISQLLNNSLSVLVR